jgi:dCMP deaminase
VFAFTKDIKRRCEIMISWDEYFMTMAYLAAMRSKDESTHCGAVIIDDMKNVVATGYNSFVRGINDNVPERQERPEKYMWFEHGERNAIYSAAMRGCTLRGCTIYVTGIPCADCARAIIQSGIKEVIVRTRENFGSEWNKSMEVTCTMFTESGVRLKEIDVDFIREIYEFTRGEKL